MSGNKSMITLALALAIVATALAVPVMAAVTVGQKAPEIALREINDTRDLKLSTMGCKATLVVFWTSTCPHCTRELPRLQQVYSDLKDRGLGIMAVSLDPNIKSAAAYLTKNNITFPVAYGGTDAGYAIANAYGVTGIPMTFVVDDKGTVTAVHVGEVDDKTLRTELAALGVK